jgi:hypothetical protein
MIKNIAFDLGGVVLALSYEQAVEGSTPSAATRQRNHV